MKIIIATIELVLDEEELQDGDVSQAVQDVVGHTGAVVIDAEVVR